MILSVKNGTFGYEGHKILFEDVSFRLAKGEVFTILGPNGSGKTTLLKCITGMLKWRQGKTYLDSDELETLSKETKWKLISYAPQAHSVVFSYTVLEMVTLGRAPYIGLFSTPSKRDRDIAKKAIEDVGISHLARESCAKISGGEMQLVLIARALASEPCFLILDEPESHLDFKNQLLVLELVEKLAVEKKITCIINTHYPDHALRISHKTLMLAKGNRHIIGETEKVICESNIKKIFGIRGKIVSFMDGGRERKTIVALASKGKVKGG